MEQLIQLLLDFFFNPVSAPAGTNLALGPLAAVGIGLGSQIVGKGLSSLFGRGERRRQRRRSDREFAMREEALDNVNESIDSTRTRARSVLDESRKTNDELYGAERSRREDYLRDAIGQNTAGSRAAVSRALLSGGGDVSGSSGITLNRIQGQANSNLANALNQIETEISRRGESYRRFQQGRSDRLFSSALAGESNLFNSLTGSSQNAERLRIQQQQAQNQLGADIGSQATSVLAAAL